MIFKILFDYSVPVFTKLLAYKIFFNHLTHTKLNQERYVCQRPKGGGQSRKRCEHRRLQGLAHGLPDHLLKILTIFPSFSLTGPISLLLTTKAY